MRCISCGAEGHALTLNDASKSLIGDGTPMLRRLLSSGGISCHYEATGIEPDCGFDGTPVRFIKIQLSTNLRNLFIRDGARSKSEFAVASTVAGHMRRHLDASLLRHDVS